MAAEEWQVQLVRDALNRASDIGERRSRAQLQEECGMGHGDLDAVLEELRAGGEASEVAPDEFESVPEDVREARERARAGEDEPEAPARAESNEAELAATRGMSLAEAERRAGRGAPSTGGAPPPAEKRVELPAGVAAALDVEALGRIVTAGVEEARSVGARFVLVIEP